MCLKYLFRFRYRFEIHFVVVQGCEQTETSFLYGSKIFYIGNNIAVDPMLTLFANLSS